MNSPDTATDSLNQSELSSSTQATGLFDRRRVHSLHCELWYLIRWLAFLLSCIVIVDFDVRVGCLIALVMTVHELGHHGMGRLLDTPVKRPWFSPFLGGADEVDMRETNHMVDLAVFATGRILGLATSDLFLLFGDVLHHWSFIVAGVIGIGIHLINLLPIPPLDDWWFSGAFAPYPMIVTIISLGLWFSRHFHSLAAMELVGTIVVILGYVVCSTRGRELGPQCCGPRWLIGSTS